MIHKIVIDKRIHSALFGQIARGIAGILVLYSIARFSNLEDVANWYLLQSIFGLALASELGLGGYLSSYIALQSKDNCATTIKQSVELAKLAIYIGSALLLIVISYFIVYWPSLSVVTISALALGTWCALTATLLQGLLQGAGFVTDTLFYNALSQVILALAVGILFLFENDIDKLACAWSLGNISWALLLYRLYTSKIGPIDIKIDALAESLVHAKNQFRSWRPYLYGMLSNLVTGRLIVPSLALAFITNDFARIAYTQNVMVSISSLMSFAMNGGAVNVLRAKAGTSKVEAWRKYTIVAISTILLIWVFHLILHYALSRFVPQIEAKLLIGTQYKLLLLVAITAEAVCSWFRYIAQSAGKLDGVALGICGSVITVATAVLTQSIIVYLITRSCWSIVTAVVDYKGAHSAINK